MNSPRLPASAISNGRISIPRPVSSSRGKADRCATKRSSRRTGITSPPASASLTWRRAAPLSGAATVVALRQLDSLGLRGDMQILENLGISNYNSLQAKLERRFANGFTLLASYTYGKALTDSVDHLSTSGAGNGVDVGEFKEPQDPHNRRIEYGPSEFDVKHRFVLSGVWQLPFGRGRAMGLGGSRAADLAFGGWEF